MKFHYTRLGKDGDKRYRVQEFENQLRSGKKNKEWYESIIRDVRTSYENGCPAAANLIGKILDCNDEKFPIKYRGNFRNMSAMPFYKESADAGYVLDVIIIPWSAIKWRRKHARKRKNRLAEKGKVLSLHIG